MTDDQINRRVAEIEGWHPNANSDHLHACWWFRGNERHGGGPPPYATDWAWCGPLVEKYDLDVYRMRGRKGKPWVCMRHDVKWLPEYSDETPQRAICLAVIAANPPAAADDQSGR